MAGYSLKNLIDKLGVKAGMRVIVMRPPTGFLELLPDLDDRAIVAPRLVGKFDYIQYFATSAEQLSAVLANLALHLESDGMLWVCWVKKTSPLHTGLDENMVRQLGLSAGLVDVKVAALTKDWSGLKFVFRVSDR